MKWGHMKHWDDGIYYGVASLVVKQKIKNPSFDTVLDENRKEVSKRNNGKKLLSTIISLTLQTV